MANRSKNRRRKKNKKRGALGILSLELIGVAAFAALLTVAQGQRATAVDASQASDRPIQSNNVAIESTGDWHSHDPRFTQVMGQIWEAAF